MACLGTIAALGLAVTLVANGPAKVPVVIGTEAPFAPYTLIDPDGQITGFERDIADAVCARAALDCRWKTARFDRLIPGVMSGEFDIVLGGMAVTPERMQLVDFSLPYESAQETHWLYGFDGAPEPDRARIGVQSGTIHQSHAKAKGWQIIPFGTTTDLVKALQEGQIDLAFGSLTSELEGLPDIDMRFEEDIPDLGTAMAVCRGNDGLLSKINTALEAMQADGTIDEITARWL